MGMPGKDETLIRGDKAAAGEEAAVIRVNDLAFKYPGAGQPAVRG